MNGRSLAAVALALVGSSLALVAQQDPSPPVFRSRVDVIEVELRVVNERGRAVVDLNDSEVEVWEDGRRQQITAFTRVAAPTEPPSALPFRSLPTWFSAPDVASNRISRAGRIFVIILDDLHVDRRHTHVVKRAARQFVEQHLKPGDLASVVYTGVRPDAAQDFTSDRQLLLAAIDKFVGRKLPPASIERMEQYNILFRGRGRPQFEDLRDRHDGERAFNARAAMASIETISGVLGRITGRRKAALYFSEGVDYDLSGLRSRGRVPAASSGPTVLAPTVPTGGGEADAVGRLDVHSHAHDVLLSIQAAMGAASRANVTVYALDVRGGNNSDALSDLGGPLDDPTLGLSVQDANQEMRDSEEGLALLAASTGGFATLTATRYDAAFDRIVREGNDYYLLAYSPWNPAPDGTYRDIKVHVKRRGVRVFARKGYYAARKLPPRAYKFVVPGISTETSTLVMAPIPWTGLSLDAQAVALKRGKKRADIIVTTQMDGRDLAGNAAGGSVSNSLELALMAIDSSGKVQDAAGRVIDIQLDANASRILRDSGYRVVGRLQVPPGRYQVRQAVRERSGGRAGSVFVDIEVPNFTKGLAMSGVMLTSRQATIVPTAIDPDTLKRLPVLPSVRRTFSPGDELTAAAEVYDSSSPDVDIIVTLVDAEGQERHRQMSKVARGDFKAAGGVYRHEASIPLGNVSGDLMLVVEARSGAGEAAVTRRVPIAVAPQ